MDKQKENKPVSYRLPEKIKSLITILAQKLMISRTAVVTLAILDFAKKENVNTENEID
jgi:predicted transcriptional regulator